MGGAKRRFGPSCWKRLASDPSLCRAELPIHWASICSGNHERGGVALGYPRRGYGDIRSDLVRDEVGEPELRL